MWSPVIRLYEVLTSRRARRRGDKPRLNQLEKVHTLMTTATRRFAVKKCPVLV
jgi:hypothetical protein